MSILELLFLNKKESFSTFMQRVESIFRDIDLCTLLNEQAMHLQWYLPSFMREDEEVKTKYIKTCCHLINNAIFKAQDKKRYVSELEYETLETSLRNISEYLSFNSVSNADERLLTSFYLKNNIIFSLLQLSFFAIIYTDYKTCRRFELMYSLWRNAIEFSFAGCVEELGRMLPYYITYYRKSIFIIDPTSGEIKRFLKKGGLRNTNIKGLVKDEIYGKKVIFALTERGEKVPLVEYTEYGYKEISKADIFSKDMKKSERQKSGSSIEKMWLSTDICNCENEMGKLTNYYLKDHIFICLMVFGLEPLKFVAMEGASILTIDHKDSVPFNNKISNLCLLTRCSNVDKEYNKSDFYFNFFEFFNDRLKIAQQRQDDFDFRVNIG